MTPVILRVLRILEYLRLRRTLITAEQLAEHFCVSRRQIYRDLNTIREAGIPLDTDPGVGGGIRINKRYFDAGS